MNFSQNIIKDDLLNELTDTINTATIESLSTIFGCKLNITQNFQDHQRAIISHVSIWQGLDSFKFYFVFDENFLKSLITKIYNQEEAQGNRFSELAMDTACELVNIICNRIKAFLNEQGFQFMMDIPDAMLSKESQPITSHDPLIKTNYSLETDAEKSDNILFINFSSEHV